MNTRQFVFALCMGFLTLACGGESGSHANTPETGSDTDQPPPVSTEGCAAIAQQCQAKQQGCQGATEAEAAFCQQCPEGQVPAGELALCAAIPGDQVLATFGTIELDAGQELNGVCQSYNLNNPEELWVNAVEFRSQGFYHHSNWFFVPEGQNAYPDGVWQDCYDNGFHEIEAAVMGGVLYAQSTQVLREVQKFPEGAAVRIPPYSRIIGATHLLNVSFEATETTNDLVLYTIPTDEVQVKLTPFRLTYFALDIPPGGTSQFTGTCDVAESLEGLNQGPMEMKLYYALPHLHSLGTGFRLEVAGGEKDGEMIFEQEGYGSDPFGRVFDPPIDLTGSNGLRFTCTYNNPREETVGWGIGDQEMCVMLGFAESPIAFDGSVNEGALTQPESGEAGLEIAPVQNSGPCVVNGFPFDQTKAGGSAK